MKKTMQGVMQWFYFYGPFQINPDEDDPDTWDFAGGWFIEFNDGSHMEPEEWQNLQTFPELEP